MRLVKSRQTANIHTTDAIAVSQHKRFIAHILADPFHTTARHGLQAGIRQRHPPRLGMIAMHHLLVASTKIERNIRLMQKIMGEIFLDRIPLISQANNKIIKAKV